MPWHEHRPSGGKRSVFDQLRVILGAHTGGLHRPLIVDVACWPQEVFKTGVGPETYRLSVGSALPRVRAMG